MILSKPQDPSSIIFITYSQQRKQREHKIQLVVAYRSTYLRGLIDNWTQSEPTSSEISLPGVDHNDFELYLWWLSAGYVAFPFNEDPVGQLVHNAASASQVKRTLSWTDCAPLLRAHILGSQFKDESFQDYIIDLLILQLHPGEVPDLKAQTLVFRSGYASSNLQRFMADRLDFGSAKYSPEVVGIFFIRLIEGRVSEHDNDNACEYHAHAPGGCYRLEKDRENKANRRRKLPAITEEEEEAFVIDRGYLPCRPESSDTVSRQSSLAKSENSMPPLAANFGPGRQQSSGIGKDIQFRMSRFLTDTFIPALLVPERSLPPDSATEKMIVAHEGYWEKPLPPIPSSSSLAPVPNPLGPITVSELAVAQRGCKMRRKPLPTYELE